MPKNIKTECEAIHTHIMLLLRGQLSSLDKAVLLNITNRRAVIKARYND